MRAFLIGLFFLLSTVTYAQQTITLPEAIRTALKNSLDIQIAKDNLLINAVNNHIGVAGGLPTVSGVFTDNQQISNLNQALSNGTNIDKTGVTGNNANVGVTGSLLLFNGGRVIATKKRLEELQKLTQEQLNSMIQNVVANVMFKYYSIVQQQGLTATLQQSLAVSRQKLQIIETQRSVGLANDADLFQAQLDLASQVQAIETQQIVIDQAKTDLLRLMTISPKTTITISDTIITDKAIDLEAILGNIERNPDVLAADETIAINKLIVREREALRYPSLFLNGGVNYGRTQSTGGFTLLNQNYGPSLGITLNVPIYAGTIYLRQAQVATVNVNIADTQKEIVVQNYNANAIKAWQSYSRSLKLVETELQNYAIAQKLLNLVLLRFRLRQATIVDVKLAQQSFENSGYSLLNFSYNAKIAEITLKQLAYKLEF